MYHRKLASIPVQSICLKKGYVCPSTPEIKDKDTECALRHKLNAKEKVCRNCDCKNSPRLHLGACVCLQNVLFTRIKIGITSHSLTFTFSFIIKTCRIRVEKTVSSIDNAEGMMQNKIEI